MTTTQERRVTCPNCSNKFTIREVMSQTTMGQDTDFRPRHAGATTYDLIIHTCQKCGLSGFMGQFEGRVSKRVSQLIAERITPLVNDELARPWQRYEYAAWIAEWREQDDDLVGNYYLRASWCCRDNHTGAEDNAARFYRAKAMEHFERALTVGQVRDSEIGVITYLIGELHRRNSEFDEASSWFSRAVELPDGDDDGRWVANLARKQAKLAERSIPGDAESQ